MVALKVLADGRSRFTGRRWPLPEGDRPAEWVDVSGPLALCANGIHACTIPQLPPWLGEELWRIELGGEILDSEVALIASRARLLGPVATWDEASRTEFGQACAARVGGVADAVEDGGVLLGAIGQLAAAGRAGPAGYWAAVLAGEAVAGRRVGPDYDAAFADEREAQADWLRRRLAPEMCVA